MSDTQKIDLLIRQNRLDEAEAALLDAINDAPADDAFHFILGKLYWRQNRRAEATTEFLRATDLNPSSPAKVALDSARDIADFFNPDLYNP